MTDMEVNDEIEEDEEGISSRHNQATSAKPKPGHHHQQKNKTNNQTAGKNKPKSKKPAKKRKGGGDDEDHESDDDDDDEEDFEYENDDEYYKKFMEATSKPQGNDEDDLKYQLRLMKEADEKLLMATESKEERVEASDETTATATDAQQPKTKVDPDGTEYEWDPAVKGWFPKVSFFNL
jgi:hypothetical protein